MLIFMFNINSFYYKNVLKICYWCFFNFIFIVIFTIIITIFIIIMTLFKVGVQT